MKTISAPLSDQALADINQALPWFAGTALPDGRVVGNIGTREHKRDTLQAVPDKRIVQLHRRVDLAGKTVLEVGCFEGIHTLGLLQMGADVVAIDVRPLNVIKTLARLAAHGCATRVHVVDLEDPAVVLGAFDVVFHCGVLYHLEDPVTHLLKAMQACRVMYLDTHVAEQGRDDDMLLVSGRRFRGYRHGEGGWQDPFSGRGSSAFWLRQDDLLTLLDEGGFDCELWSERAERNGARVGLLAVRRPA